MSKETITAFDEQRSACPNTGDMHRYFIFKTETVFEQVEVDMSFLERTILPEALKGPVYTKEEYAILGCNCGSVIKQKVKK